MSRDLAPTTDEHQQETPGTDSLTETINERYRVVRCLGRGGMGDVCLVHDNLNGGLPLALKRVRSDKIDPKSVAVLRNEFLSLASLPHPNLSRVYDFGADRRTGDLFFTAEYVEGVHWLEACQGLDLSRPEGLETFAEVLSQVLRGLEFIHCRGLVHADIKPENLLVTRVDPDGSGKSRMKIIDFGLARKARFLGGEKILGTPYYVAPETILGSQIDRRTDLYSLGVVLYHLVTGRLPFLGDSNLAILRGHVEKAPVPPQQVVPGLQESLGDFILRLMEKSPGDRFQNAPEALHAFNRLFNFAIPLETPETSRSYPEVAALVGRESESSQLRSVFIQAAEMAPESFDGMEELPWHSNWSPAAVEEQPITPLSPGRMVILLGERGLGKRRLVDDLRHVGQTLGARFVQVECGGADEEGAGGLQSLLDELSRFEWPAWKNGLPPHIQSALMLADSRESIEDGVSEDGIWNAVQNVSEGLLASAREQPTVLHFHDLHRAGRTVTQLVRCLVEMVVRQGRSRLLILATAVDRSEEQAGEFRELYDDVCFRNQVYRLKVGRLGAPQVGRLLETAFPDCHFPAGFARRVLEESDGNLEVILTIVQHFIDRKKIVRRLSGWELEGDYEHEDFPGRIRTELKARIAALPEEALRLAMAFACLGDGCDPDLAIELAATPPSSIGRCLALLQEHQILESRSDEGQELSLAFVHSSSRTILYELIPTGQLAAMHERAGSLLEKKTSTHQAPSHTLAYHYLKAGNSEKGLRYGLEAGRELAGQSAPADAIELYEQVLELARPADEKLLATVEGELAALRFRAGDYGGVIRLLDSGQPSDDSTGSLPSRLWAQIHGARARTRLGHFREAAEILDRLDSTGEDHAPDAIRDAALLARAELHRLRGDPVESLRCCDVLSGRMAEAKEPWTRCQFHLLVAESLSGIGHDEEAARECQNALRLMDSGRENARPGWSFFCRGRYYRHRGQPRKALKQFRKCLALARESGDQVQEADCLLETGRICSLLGRPQEAHSLLLDALKIYEKSRDLPSSVTTLSLLGETSRLTGDTELCTRTLTDLLERSASMEQDRIRLDALLTSAGLAVDGGELPRGERYLRQAESHCSEGSGTGDGRLGILALGCDARQQAGRWVEALDLARRGLLGAREAGHVVHQAGFLQRSADMLCRVGQEGEARRSLVALTDLARRHELTVSEGWARMIEGVLLAGKSRLGEAQRALDRARAIFLRLGSERDLARLLLEHGRLRLSLGDHEQAYLDLKESLHLARKLGCTHLQCEIHLATGRLEVSINPDDVARAGECFRRAGVVALAKGFPEIVWRARCHLGRLLEARGHATEARGCFQEAEGTLTALVKDLPEEMRESYLESLDSEECAALAGGGRCEAATA